MSFLSNFWAIFYFYCIAIANQNYKNWVKDGKKKENAKHHFNCTEMPLIKFDGLVMEKFPPPELHIFTGIFNHMYNGMLENEELCTCAEKWADKVGVSRRFCPSLSFVGNHCKSLLHKIDLLMDTNPPRSVHKDRLDCNVVPSLE